MPHLLDGLTVKDPDGHDVRLGQLWAKQTAVLVFVRHFGCLFCRQQVTDLVAQRERIHALGAELVVIGHGTVDEARAFRDEHHLTCPLFTDPERQAYRALEMRHGRRTLMTPRVVVHTVTAMLQGFRQTFVAGDPLQQGGVIVIAPGGVERYRHISREAGDHPPVSRILAALQP
jgi:peroxiredoxin